MRNENERSKSNSVKQKTKEEEKRYHFVFCSFLKKAHFEKKNQEKRGHTAHTRQRHRAATLTPATRWWLR
jgi:hypothetical protein